jgi:plastocyanin
MFSSPPPRRACVLALLLAAVPRPWIVLSGDSPAGAATMEAAVASGSLQGEVTLEKRRPARTAERYASSGGEQRDVQDIPVVVYLEGPMESAPPARPSGPLELVQQGEAFRPRLLVVPVGAKVLFPNADPVFHNVFSYSRPKRFDLGRYPKGEAKTVVFDRPGYVKVLCEAHKWMRAGVLVVENPYYAIVSDDGRFRIDGIPAGRHTVAVEHFDKRSKVDTDIPDGGTATITVTL